MHSPAKKPDQRMMLERTGCELTTRFAVSKSCCSFARASNFASLAVDIVDVGQKIWRGQNGTPLKPVLVVM